MKRLFALMMASSLLFSACGTDEPGSLTTIRDLYPVFDELEGMTCMYANGINLDGGKQMHQVTPAEFMAEQVLWASFGSRQDELAVLQAYLEANPQVTGTFDKICDYGPELPLTFSLLSGNQGTHVQVLQANGEQAILSDKVEKGEFNPYYMLYDVPVAGSFSIYAGLMESGFAEWSVHEIDLVNSYATLIEHCSRVDKYTADCSIEYIPENAES